MHFSGRIKNFNILNQFLKMKTHKPNFKKHVIKPSNLTQICENEKFKSSAIFQVNKKVNKKVNIHDL